MTSTISFPYVRSSESTSVSLAIGNTNPMPTQIYYGGAGTAPGAPTLVSNLNPLPVTSSDDTSADPNFDGFSRSRVAAPLSLFSSSFQSTLQSSKWVTSAVTLTAPYVTTNATVGTCFMQSRLYHPAQMGRTLVFSAAAVLAQVAPAAAETARVGLFDAAEGFFFQTILSGTPIFQVGVRKASADTLVASTVFNIDKLDGTGPSAINIAPADIVAYRRLFVISVDWTGSGQVTFGLVLRHRIVPLHRVDFGDGASDTTPETNRISLPARFEATYATDIRARLFAVDVSVDGGAKPVGKIYSTPRGPVTKALHTSITATEKPIIAIRPRVSVATLRPRVQIIPRSVDTLTIARGDLLCFRAYRFFGAATLGPLTLAVGDTFVASGQTDAAAEVTGGGAVTSSIVVAGNRELLGTWFGGRLELKDSENAALGVGVAGTDADHDIFVVTCQRVGGGTPDETIDVSVTWEEIE